MYDLEIQEKQAAEAFHRFAVHERLITMNEEAVKEFISINFIRLIAENEGLIVTQPQVDIGDDLVIKQVRTVRQEGKLSYYASGRAIELQLKCTTTLRWKQKGNFYHFRLKTRNFNNLVFRHREWISKRITPYLLIILVLPLDKSKWLDLDLTHGLKIAGKAFWYLPPPDAEMIVSKTHVRISVPVENQLSLDFFSKKINQYFNHENANS